MSTSAPPTGYPGSQEHQYRPGFNQEELRVLRECNRESFYYRCVPLAAAAAAATAAAMRKGILKPSPRFGYVPKMLAGVLAGYVLGKVSYQNACAEKLMRLPDSPVGEALRKRKGRLPFQETVTMDPGFSVSSPGDSSFSSSSLARSPGLDDDLHRPDQHDHNEGLVDYERGVEQSLSPYSGGEEGSGGPPQAYTTYHELRRANRHEYLTKMADKYRRDRPGDQTPEGGLSMEDLPQDPSQSYRPPASPPPPPPRTNVKRNQYGDEVYE